MDDRFQWLTRGDAQLPALPYEDIQAWLHKVAEAHGRIIGGLNYVFCDDPTILDVNRRFLGHDYFTDIITFDDSRGRLVRGDMFISLDTVRTNADTVSHEPYERELRRVIVHGLLHLCGINDKGPGEREIMEAHEDAALGLLGL